MTAKKTDLTNLLGNCITAILLQKTGGLGTTQEHVSY